MPKELAVIGDRVFFWSIRRQIKLQKLRGIQGELITVNYLSLWQSTYIALSERPPPGARPNVRVEPLLAWWKGLTARQREEHSRLVGFKLDRILRPP